jgi:hypothetical protein
LEKNLPDLKYRLAFESMPTVYARNMSRLNGGFTTLSAPKRTIPEAAIARMRMHNTPSASGLARATIGNDPMPLIKPLNAADRWSFALCFPPPKPGIERGLPDFQAPQGSRRVPFGDGNRDRCNAP